LVEEFEGRRLAAYRDGNGIWTIGCGHTGAGVVEGLTCTQAEADAWLNQDLGVADEALDRLVKVPVNQNQYDALVSLVYNIGQGNFAHSSCLKALNARNYAEAARAIGMWDLVAGQVSDGLKRRRTAEQRMFMETV
jgi:lysozyme